jgi:hypothetical protein
VFCPDSSVLRLTARPSVADYCVYAPCGAQRQEPLSVTGSVHYFHICLLHVFGSQALGSFSICEARPLTGDPAPCLRIRRAALRAITEAPTMAGSGTATTLAQIRDATAQIEIHTTLTPRDLGPDPARSLPPAGHAVLPAPPRPPVAAPPVGILRALMTAGTPPTAPPAHARGRRPRASTRSSNSSISSGGATPPNAPAGMAAAPTVTAAIATAMTVSGAAAAAVAPVGAVTVTVSVRTGAARTTMAITGLDLASVPVPASVPGLTLAHGLVHSHGRAHGLDPLLNAGPSRRSRRSSSSAGATGRAHGRRAHGRRGRRGRRRRRASTK